MQTNRLHFRACTVDDAAQLALIDTRASISPWSKMQYRTGLSAGNQGLLLLLDQTPLGYVLYQCVLDTAEIFTLALDPQHQRRGWGTALMRTLIQQLHQQKITHLILEVRTSNVPARAFYKQLGMRIVGRRAHYYRTATGREDALLMELII